MINYHSIGTDPFIASLRQVGYIGATIPVGPKQRTASDYNDYHEDEIDSDPYLEPITEARRQPKRLPWEGVHD